MGKTKPRSRDETYKVTADSNECCPETRRDGLGWGMGRQFFLEKFGVWVPPFHKGSSELGGLTYHAQCGPERR
eukprot:CAMPEP_0206530186 /NCGR_PEP_ID=MMETSP0325_2-20121206/3020_1 /ASSEMBLY_ACC=CAM_ASM_000347 /TAXON_ID=2866 /ORGANISM="Crypthecodinium cohnii, Strain Seligo" /LENGTH=72 /DNA_ID=CAMNT_0054026191 /DNA_START=70 /DNA_END=285 /DNA_ORIENTATION=-